MLPKPYSFCRVLGEERRGAFGDCRRGRCGQAAEVLRITGNADGAVVRALDPFENPGEDVAPRRVPDAELYDHVFLHGRKYNIICIVRKLTSSHKGLS